MCVGVESSGEPSTSAQEAFNERCRHLGLLREAFTSDPIRFKIRHRMGPALSASHSPPGRPNAGRAGGTPGRMRASAGAHAHPPKKSRRLQPLDPRGGRQVGGLADAEAGEAGHRQTSCGTRPGREPALGPPAWGQPVTGLWAGAAGAPLLRSGQQGASSPGTAPSRTHKRLTRVPRRQKQGHRGPAPEPSLCGRAPSEGLSCQQRSKNPPVQAEGNRQAEPGVRGEGAGGLSSTSARWDGHHPEGLPASAGWGQRGRLGQKGGFPARTPTGKRPPHGDGTLTQCTGNSSTRLQSPRTRVSSLRDCSPQGQDHPQRADGTVPARHTQFLPRTPRSAPVQTLGAGSANPLEKSGPQSSGGTRMSRRQTES